MSSFEETCLRDYSAIPYYVNAGLYVLIKLLPGVNIKDPTGTIVSYEYIILVIEDWHLCI